MRTMSVKAPPPVIDSKRAQALRTKAIAEPLDPDIARKWMKRDRVGFGTWLYHEYGLFVPPCYIVIYTFDKETRSAQLSVSTAMLPIILTPDIMEQIGKAFGMGDRTKWSDSVPPNPPKQTAFNVIQTLD